MLLLNKRCFSPIIIQDIFSLLLLNELKLLFSIIFFLFWGCFLIGQELDIKKYSTIDGLSLSQISSIVQLSNGQIVFGTYGGGINIFDGRKFKTFGIEDGISNNSILSMSLDSNGILWLGTDNGVTRYDGVNPAVYTKVDGLADNAVWFVFPFDDKIWFGTLYGLSYYDTIGDSIHTFNNIELIQDKSIWGITNIDDNRLWLSTVEGVVILEKSGNEYIVKDHFLKDVSVYYTQIIDSVYSILATSQGLYLLNEHSVIDRIDRKSGLSSDEVYTILNKKENHYWIGTEKGVNEIVIEKDKIQIKRSILENYQTSIIYEDLSGSIWFGTDNGLFQLLNDNFQNILYNEKRIEAWSIYRDSRNRLLVGTENHGLLEYKDGTLSSNFKNNIQNKITRCLHEDNKGNIWIGTEAGLYVLRGKRISPVLEHKDLSNSDIEIIESTNDGKLLLGTAYNGLLIVDYDKFVKIDNINSEPIETIYTIYESDDNILLGTSRGVVEFKNNTINRIGGLSQYDHQEVLGIVPGRNDEIFFGIYELGIIRYSFGEGVLDTIDVGNGLNDNSILAMKNSADGTIWATTNHGINKFSTDLYYSGNKYFIEASFPGDGLASVEAIQNALLVDNDEVWMGTILGLVNFSVDKYTTDFLVHENHIIKFKVRYSDSTWEKSTNILYTDLCNQKIFISDQNNIITIGFNAVNTTNASKVKYIYKLNEGAWSNPSSKNEVEFFDLPPGEYTFQTKVVSKNPYPNNAKIKFTIPIPFYQTYYFLISTGLITIIILFILYRVRVTKVEKRNRELLERIDERNRYEAELKLSRDNIQRAKEKAERSEKIKTEFLAQMSHEIRSPINTILSFTGFLKNELKDQLEDELLDCFNSIDLAGQRIIRTIDLILNMSEVQTGTIELIIKPVDLIDDVIANVIIENKYTAVNKGLELSLINNLPEEKAVINIDEYTITQIFNNLVDNAIKYTEKGKIDIIADYEDHIISIEVKDTGIGISEDFLPELFDPFSQEDTGYTRKFDGNGLGLALVKNYCDLNNATISVQSRQGEGTSMIVRFSHLEDYEIH